MLDQARRASGFHRQPSSRQADKLKLHVISRFASNLGSQWTLRPTAPYGPLTLNFELPGRSSSLLFVSETVWVFPTVRLYGMSPVVSSTLPLTDFVALARILMAAGFWG